MQLTPHLNTVAGDTIKKTLFGDGGGGGM